MRGRGDLSHTSGKLGTYRALVIGINDYQDKNIPFLKTAVKDARELAKLLQTRYGFKVDLLLDRQATRKTIIDKLRELAANSSDNESVLIYYAGHGEIDKLLNSGWWVPANAKGGDPSTYIDNTVVQMIMRGMKARHVLLVSDSCYSGTLFGEGRSLPPLIDDKYYLNLYNEKSRWGMTSGNKTPVSDSGSEGHSVFAYQLLKALTKNEQPYITTQELCTRIAPIIANNSEQQPLCSPVRNTGDQGGGFVFVASAAPPAPYFDQFALQQEALERERQELARAKEELERQKALAAERRKIEAERQQLAMGSRPQEQPGDKRSFTDPTTGMEFVFVPAGCFEMGDAFGDGDADEKPVHEVCVGDFYLGKYEATQGQWQAVLGNNPSSFKSGDNYPVEQVSWNDVQDFIVKLNQRSGKSYRLPTEAEWEYAARSGGKKEKYAGGGDVDTVAWYASNSGKSTHPVGTKAPNGLGIYDMSGNVWEWVQDWYGDKYYGASVANNPPGPLSGAYRVLRGGSWLDETGLVCAANRFRANPSGRDDYIGFRLVLSGP